MNNGESITINEEQFLQLDEKSQHLVLYQNMIRLENKVNRKQKRDALVSGVTGFAGGIFAVASKWFFFLKG